MLVLALTCESLITSDDEWSSLPAAFVDLLFHLSSFAGFSPGLCVSGSAFYLLWILTLSGLIQASSLGCSSLFLVLVGNAKQKFVLSFFRGLGGMLLSPELSSPGQEWARNQGLT